MKTITIASVKAGQGYTEITLPNIKRVYGMANIVTSGSDQSILEICAKTAAVQTTTNQHCINLCDQYNRVIIYPGPISLNFGEEFRILTYHNGASTIYTTVWVD